MNEYKAYLKVYLHQIQSVFTPNTECILPEYTFDTMRL